MFAGLCLKLAVCACVKYSERVCHGYYSAFVGLSRNSVLKYEPKGEWKLANGHQLNVLSFSMFCVCVRLLWISATQDHFHRGVLWFHDQGVLHTLMQWHTKQCIHMQHSYSIKFVNQSILSLIYQQCRLTA